MAGPGSPFWESLSRQLRGSQGPPPSEAALAPASLRGHVEVSQPQPGARGRLGPAVTAQA